MIRKKNVSASRPTRASIGLPAVGAACLLSLTAFVRDSSAQILLGRAARASDSLERFEFEATHRELDGADMADPELRLLRGKLAVYESDCDRAVELLSTLEADKGARAVLAIAKGCARVMASSVTEVDDTAGVWIRFQDEHDRPLKALLVETVVRAREALSRDLGVTWPKPTRILVVRDQFSLAAVTGLPYESAQKTGTVAVAKWARVAMLSPRAASHGFVWRDTLAHELTHLAVSRATADQAPLWLQEGIAKTEEIRWRPPGPFDDRPSSDDIARDGIRRKVDLPLDHLGPSLAMLPNADVARVAYAEVTSFVQYLERTKPGMLPNFLSALGKGRGVPEALESVMGSPFAELDKRWRASLLPTASAVRPARESFPKADARERARLAELLLGRGHAKEAWKELERASFPKDDPVSRALRAETLDKLDRKGDALAEVGQPADVRGPFAPYWAIRGQLLPVGESREGAFVEALSNDPYEPKGACVRPADAPLCEAAKQFPIPP